MLTFNYDLVPDILGKHRAKERLASFEIPTPDEVSVIGESEAPCVLKLHGSIDWAHDEGERVVKSADPEALLQDRTKRIAIAAPGGSKALTVKTSFSALWEAGVQRLRDADVIVFVGFRFPETDNYAKWQIMKALRDRQSTRPLTIHIVLGPNTSDENVRRMESMLRWALAHCDFIEQSAIGAAPDEGQDRYPEHKVTLIVQPQWSQDFFAVFQRENLHAWRNYNRTMRGLCSQG